MTTLSNTEFITKGIKIEDKNEGVGMWITYEHGLNSMVHTHINKDPTYVSESLYIPMTPSEIFVEQQYTNLMFEVDFIPGTNTRVTSERDGILPLSISLNNIYVSYKPSQITDTFYFVLYSNNNQHLKRIIKPIVISPGVIVPTNIENNPTINTLNNTYTNLTMVFSQKIDAGEVSTFSSESSVSNVQISNGKCKFDYTTPTTHTSDKIVFTNLRAKNTQISNTVQTFFEFMDLKTEPIFIGWTTTPGSQYFSYVGGDSLEAIFTKNIQTCSSIISTTGTPSTIIPTSIIGNKVKFEWTSLTAGSVNFTFNGLTATDGTIDANNNNLTMSGTIILYTPAEIIGWKDNILPIEPNSQCAVSVIFNKVLSNSRLPVITNTENNTIIVTSIVGNTINFTVSTTNNPAQAVYTFNNVAGSDGSIKNGSTLSVGASIVSVQVENDLANNYMTTKKLVNDRTQKVKIILSKAIIGNLALLPNTKCTIGSVSMINNYTAVFSLTPLSTTDSSLTINSPIILSQDSSQSTISYTFDLIPSQKIVQLVESTNKNLSVSVFDVGTPLSLSFELSKEISFSNGVTITSPSGTVSNITNTSMLGKNYYNFNFTPVTPGLNQSITITGAKDTDGFFYTLTHSNLHFKYPLPSSITNVASRTLTLNGPNRQYISASNITVYTKALNTQQISSATVTGYNQSTGVVSFITSPSKIINTIHVAINSPVSTDTALISADYIVNWAPKTATNVTTLSVPEPYKVVSGKQVTLQFHFTADEPFDANAITAFTATVNGTAISLNSATISNTTLIVSFTAPTVSDYIFVFYAYGVSFTFTIFGSEVYVFPTITNTIRDIPFVTIGENLVITSIFSENFQPLATATVAITPQNKSTVTYQPVITQNSIVVTHTILFDLAHTGTITIQYGNVQNIYSWGSGLLTSSNIYSFPSTFTYNGTANGYVGGQLKEATQGMLTLIFSDGDIFSNDTQTQIEYVKYIQDGIVTTIPQNALSCSDPDETITILAITPASRNDLEIKVKLRSPDNIISSEISTTVFSASFVHPPTAVQNTPGLELWLDGSDPQGNGAPVATNTEITIWADKSGFNRNAIVQSADKAKFIRNTKNKRGSVAFTQIQRYKSTFAFPSTSYTIICVVFMRSGAIVSSPLSGNLSMEVYGESYYGQLQTHTSYDSNPNSPANSSLYIVGNSWNIVTMVVNGNVCKPYINSIPQDQKGGTTVPFDSLVIGGQSLQSNVLYGWGDGLIGEILVYSQALYDTDRLEIESTLGKKWGTWPYNVSPMWNLSSWPPSNYGFGSEVGLPGFWNTATNSPSDAYWMWYENTFDTTLSALDSSNMKGYVNEGVHINTTRGYISYLLNNPQISNTFYHEYKPLISSEWAIRWGYKKVQSPSAIGLGAQTIVDNQAIFVLSGFSNSSFTNGTELLIVDGTRFGYDSTPYIITEIDVKGTFTHFELKQTTGPFVTTNGYRVILGRNNVSDFSGLGTVAKSNLVAWLDGSDPFATGEAPIDGTDLQIWIDKSGNKRNAIPRIPRVRMQTYTSPETAGIISTKGVVTIQKQLYGAEGCSTRLLFRTTEFPYTNYTICMLCKVSKVHQIYSPLVIIANEHSLWFGAKNGFFTVHNNSWNSLGNVATVETKVMTEEGEKVPILDKWMFLCMTFTSTTNTIIPYANGTKLKSIPNVAHYEIRDSTKYMHIFGQGSDGSVMGQLAEFGIYDRVLSHLEIATLTSNISSKYDLVLSQVGPATSSTPFSILGVTSYPPLGLNSTSDVSLLLTGVSTSAPTAKVFYSYTSEPESFVQLGTTFSLSGNTIPFTFTPTVESPVYFSTKSIVSGVDSSFIQTSPQTVGTYPTGIFSVTSYPLYPKENVLSKFTIELTGVTSYTQHAKIYYSTTSNSENPTIIGTFYSFVQNTLSFNFTPSDSGFIYFYVKSINTIGEESSFLVSQSVDIFKNISWALPIVTIPYWKISGQNNIVSGFEASNQQLGKITLNGQKWSSNLLPSIWTGNQGVVLSKELFSDFSFTFAYNNQNIVVAMLSHPYATTNDFIHNYVYADYGTDPDWGIRRVFNNVSRTYSFEAYKLYYNSFPYETDTITYFQYERTGTLLTISSSRNQFTDYEIAASGTCQLNDKIICFVGQNNSFSWPYTSREANIISLVIYPTNITSVVCSPLLAEGELSTVTLQLSDVHESTSSAKVYYASTSTSTNPTQIGTTHSFINNTLTFTFTPPQVGPLFFYVKAIGNNTEQKAFLKSSIQSVDVPKWLPTNIGTIISSIPIAHQLVVDEKVELTFSFVTEANFPLLTASNLFTLDVNGVSISLENAYVNTIYRTITFEYTALSSVTHNFVFTSNYGTSYTFNIHESKVYTFPTMTQTTKNLSLITVGNNVDITSEFNTPLPLSMMATVSITPFGYLPITPNTTILNASVAYTINVEYDVVYSGTVSLMYGSVIKVYSWASGVLTTSTIYSFPSSFTYNGNINNYGTGFTLKEGTEGSLILTFAGGDMLFSSIIQTQVDYVKFVQNNIETTIPIQTMSCSDPMETITLSAITPIDTSDMIIKVRLLGPDGLYSSEFVKTITTIQPKWVPSEKGIVSSSVPNPHKLISNKEVQLTFSFIATDVFPSTEASRLFTLTLNGDPLSLTNAIVNQTNKTVTISYTALNTNTHSFVFTSEYGTSYTFNITNVEIYTFPTILQTTKNISIVSIGNLLTITSLFDNVLPTNISASALITPTGYDSIISIASINNESAIYTITVQYDVSYYGTVNLTYGNVTQLYTWGSETLSSSSIYTFPSSFTYDGTANGLSNGIELKQGIQNSLTLTFLGGDLLFSNQTATQVNYVKYSQNNNDALIPLQSISCSETSETVTISSIIPSDTTDLTIKVKLIGPDGFYSNELSSIIPANKIESLPLSIVTTEPQSLLPGIETSITLTFSNVTSVNAISAQVFYGTTTQTINPIRIGTANYSFNGSDLTFLFTPNVIGSVYFYVKPINLSGIVYSSYIISPVTNVSIPSWVPTGSGTISSNIPSPHTLVVGSAAQLTFSFLSNENFLSSVATDIFTLKVNNITTSLTTAVVNTTARTIQIAYTASSAIDHTFEFVTIYGTSYLFTIYANEVYTFPTLNNTTRDVSLITLGQTLNLTSTFSSPLGPNVTAFVVITPTDNIPIPMSSMISGANVTYSINVQYDVVHTGSITLSYGPAQSSFAWTSNTLTNAHIYTFPSSFTYNGTSNNYGTGFHLKEGADGTLILTFSGGDMLYSSVVSTQIQYVSFTQSGMETIIPNSLLACSDPLETITISSIMPINRTDLTLNVKLKGPDGTLSTTISTIIPASQIVANIQNQSSSINFRTFSFANTNDAASVTSTPSALVASLPTGFTSTATQTNLTSMKSYYRDVNGEWAPISKTLKPPMIRCDHNSAAEVNLNLTSTGYAVIMIQCNTYRHNNPSIIWSSYPSGTKTQMCPGGNTYVAPSTSPEVALEFTSGVNSSGEILSKVTRQTQVSFAMARVTGEIARWYNGIREQSSTSAFDGTQTQTPCFGPGGGVQLQDFITVHQFNTSMQMSLDRINNNTYSTIGTGTSSTTPYMCTRTSNRCGSARFAEFAVIQSNMAQDELLSVARDYANRWCVPFAGPEIKTFRLVNTGTGNITIGYFGFSSTSEATSNLLNSSAYSSAIYTVSSGVASSATTWQNATRNTAPHQVITPGSYLQVVLNTSIENAGFLQLGLVTMAIGAQLVLDLRYTSGTWERYDLWYHYEGSVVNTVTSPLCVVGTSQTIYAKNSVLMPWKQKYRTNPNEDSGIPYNLPTYIITREGNDAYLSTLSSNLMAITWDGDRAVKFCIAQSRTQGSTLSENQVINFSQHSNAAQQSTPTYFSNLSLLEATTTKDGLYDLGTIEITRFDYFPSSMKSQYVSYVSNADTTDYDNTSLATVFVDPVTMHAAHARSMMNNERIDVNMRLRKSVTGRYYLDTPQTFDNGNVVINGYRGYCARMFSAPICRSVRSMFGLSAYDPEFGKAIDTLEVQKKYTIFSIICNPTISFMGDMSGSICPPPGDVMTIISGGNRISYTQALTLTVASSVCTNAYINNIGGGAINQSNTNSSFVPPVYKALRSCSTCGISPATTSGNVTSQNDATNYPNSSSERLYIITAVIDTTVGGANSFTNDTSLETYAKIYINGKRINTASRRTANGSSYVTTTTNVGNNPGSSWPSYFYASSSLTYGITQITDIVQRASSGNDPAQPGVIWPEGIKYPMAQPYNASGGKCFNAYGRKNMASRRYDTTYNNRLIILETKTESRVSAVYSASEVDTHIYNLSKKWGIVMAYRWVKIKNVGSVDIRFARLGFYGSHTEAHADTSGIETDQKTGAYKNLMKGYSTGVSSTVSSATVGSNGITAVLSNTVNTTPGATDATLVTILPGGSITIDLGDALTCSHVRFGNIASTGDVTLARMSIELIPTLVESETQGTPVNHVLRAAKNASGITEGQFPLYSPSILANTKSFVTSAGAHLNTSGVYLLFDPNWGNPYKWPTGFSYTSGTVYVTASTPFTITTTGSDPVAASITVYASTSQNDSSPQIVCEMADLSNTGISIANCIFPSTGTFYLFIKATSPDGAFQPTFTLSSTTVNVINYSLPSSISSATISSLLVGNTNTGQTLTLSGPNISALSMSNISVFLNTSNVQLSNCTVTTYNSSTGVVTFTASPSVIGMNLLYAKITAPIAGSTQSTTLSYASPTNQGYFIDVSPLTSSGLVVFIAPNQSASYSGSGSTLNNLGTAGGVATLNGSYESITILGKRAVHLINTNGNGSFSNISTIFLPSANTQTISIWYYITSLNFGYILDGRKTTSETYINQYQGQIGSVFTNSIFYFNGGSSQPITNIQSCFNSVSSSWQHITIIANSVQTAAIFNLFAAYYNGSPNQGLDINVGNVYVYNRVLTQSENNLNYSLGSDASSSTYTMPTSFTYSPTSGYVDGGTNTITITTSVSSTTPVPISVYYGSSSSITSISELTLIGSGTLTSGTATVSGVILAGTSYIYIRIISPSGAMGPLLCSQTTITPRAYIHTTEITSITPAVPVQNATTSYVLTLSGQDNIPTTASIYYSTTNNYANLILIGTSNLVNGIVTVSGNIPSMTYYLYARSISPSSVLGPLIVSSLVTARDYVFPSSVSFVSIRNELTTEFTFTPADTLATATVIMYYDVTNTSTTPTQCGTGTISSSGVANIICTFPSGTSVYVYAKVTSPAGVQGSLIVSTMTGNAKPLVMISSSAGEISTRTLNGSCYTCIRSSGTLTVPTTITDAEIFFIAGGGGGSFSAGAGGGAGGAAYISNATIPAGTYPVTIGSGGAGASSDGGNGTNGSNSVAFGITVYGGGGGSHHSTVISGGCGGGAGYNTGASGGSATASIGTLTGITGTLQTYGNAGGNNPVYTNYATGGGGGIGGVGGSTTTTPTGGAGGIGRSTWSEWLAATGVGEGDTNGTFWIGGGGGGSCNETNNTRRAGNGGKGGGGRGGVATTPTVLGLEGLGTSAIEYSGGGGGGGHNIIHTGAYIPPGGRGGSGVLIIKQKAMGSYTSITAPSDISGLQLWLDGSDPSNGTTPAANTQITSWVDKSGNSRHAVPVGTPKAVYKAPGTIGGIKNTLGTMYFNNTPYRIPYTNFSPTYTIFSVFFVERGLTTSGAQMSPVNTNNSCYVLSGTQDCQLYFGMLADNFTTAVGVPTSTWYNLSANTPSTSIRGQWVIATMQYNAATKTTTTFLNGITMSVKGPDASAQNNGNTWNDLYIGQANSSGADYRLQGHIGDILIYNSILSTLNRKKVESYLSLKYNVGINVTRKYTFPTSISFTSLQIAPSTTTLLFSPSDGFESATVTIYYHVTNSSTNPTQCGTGILNASGTATVACTFPQDQFIYVYAKVTSPTEEQGTLLCSPINAKPNLLPMLRYPTAGTAGTGIYNSVINSDGSWTYNGSGYTGVVVDRAFIGDFTLVLLWACSQNNAEWYKYSVIGMGAKASAQPSDFIYNTGEFYSPSSVSSSLPGYITTSWYNSNFGPGGGFAVTNWQNTYYQYKRVGTKMEYFYGISATGPWNSIRSATIGVNDNVLCIIGTAAGQGITTASVISLTIP